MTLEFGTSEWRAVIAEEFTFANVRRVCHAIGEHVLATDQANRQVGRAPAREGGALLVGYDTRFLSERFARVAADALAAAGVRTVLCGGAAPTPAVVAYVVRHRLAGAVTITASHNPPEYNGVKFTPASGAPALPETTRAIEARIGPSDVLAPSSSSASHASMIDAIVDPRPEYLDQLGRLADLDAIRRARYPVVLDPLYGATRGYLEAAFGRTGVRFQLLHHWRDAYFGGRRPDPDADGLRELRTAVAESSAVLGLATDGDGDRFGVVDEDGCFTAPNLVLALLLDYLVRTRGWRGAVARSVATTHLIDAVAAEHGLGVRETPVGFKYIGEQLASGAVVFGGEESAGLSIAGHVPDKDGVLACLLVAEMVARTGKSLGELADALFRRVGPHHSARVDLAVTEAARVRLAAVLEAPPEHLAGLAVCGVSRLDGCKLLLAGGAWLLIRPSGTEPIVRCYAEAASPEQLDSVLLAGRRLLGAPEA